ncbi:MAG: Dabb family protein [Fibromonadaceae bacterium]|jgi:hypothetical protein|nr:Dabb family protein [Fibromonadaceae bacterium]
MIVHLVFWKMKAQADGRTGEENAEIMVQRLNALNGVVPSALVIEAGTDFEKSPAAYDVGLYTRFETKEDLADYQKHPAHVHVAKWVRSVVETRAVVDFEI